MRGGDVRLIDLETVRGSEAHRRRPAVIVNNDRTNETADRFGRGVATVLPTTGLSNPPEMLCDRRIAGGPIGLALRTASRFRSGYHQDRDRGGTAFTPGGVARPQVRAEATSESQF